MNPPASLSWHRLPATRPRGRGLLALRPRILLALVGLLLLPGCSETVDRVLNNTEKADCSRPYPDWTTSPYVVPYPVGASYDLLTGNCDPGHQGENRYGYDFLMPIGSVVAASRGGEVVFSEERWSDSGRNPSENNGVVIAHGDGTFAFYFHLQQNSVRVDLGDTVIQGQVIARSGASGTGPQHLHFHISLCYPGCGTEPTTFSNTDPNPGGLSRGHYWPALPY